MVFGYDDINTNHSEEKSVNINSTGWTHQNEQQKSKSQFNFDNDKNKGYSNESFLSKFLFFMTTESELRDSWMTLIFIAIGTGVLYSTQNILAPNLTSIAEEFQFNEEERDRLL